MPITVPTTVLYTLVPAFPTPLLSISGPSPQSQPTRSLPPSGDPIPPLALLSSYNSSAPAAAVAALFHLAVRYIGFVDVLRVNTIAQIYY